MESYMYTMTMLTAYNIKGPPITEPRHFRFSPVAFRFLPSDGERREMTENEGGMTGS